MKLSESINKICHQTPGEPAIHPFIRECVRYAMGYLKYKVSCGYRISENGESNDTELESIAVDAIADLFERNESGEYIQLRQFFRGLDPSVQNDRELEIHLRRLVISKTQQALYQIFRNRDPETAKIIRNIKLAAGPDKVCSIVRTPLRDVIWFREQKTESLNDLKIADPLMIESIRSQLFALFCASDTIPVLMEKTLRILEDRTGPAIGLVFEDMVSIIREYRKVFKGTHFHSAHTEIDAVDAHFMQDELRETIQKIHRLLIRKIDSKYVSRDKFTPEIAEGLKFALKKISEDMLEGQELMSHLEYIRMALPSIGKQEYDSQIRTRFEYLVKLLKKQIQETMLANSEK